MRVFGILAILLLIVVGFFLYLRGDAFFGPAGEAPSETATQSGEEAKASGKAAGDAGASADGQQMAALEPRIIDKKLDDTTDTSGQQMALARPSFDIVRIDQNCELVAAGRAMPASVVTVFVGDQIAGEVTASAIGEWVFTSTNPLPAGSQTVNLKAKNPDGQELESGKLVIMNVPDCAKPLAERAPAIAMLVPKETEGTSATPGSVKLLQIPESKGDVSAAKDLTLGAVNYDDKGTLELSGRGQPGKSVQIYVDNQPVGAAVIDSDGNWMVVPDHSIPAGNHKLRIDQLDEAGKVISRVELPFQKAPASDVILAQGSGGTRAVVQPGNSLWRIARRVYGEGMEYTVIYQANQDQIRDPDLIFPGQIFTLPKK
ncbi:MAG: LysM peptidoglycan-binding domain-containing protein [Sneathiella sp.]|nr:LysM peptidoglycan-binding domain-containing protein [Sneathiella sp.]